MKIKQELKNKVEIQKKYFKDKRLVNVYKLSLLLPQTEYGINNSIVYLSTYTAKTCYYN